MELNLPTVLFLIWFGGACVLIGATIIADGLDATELFLSVVWPIALPLVTIVGWIAKRHKYEKRDGKTYLRPGRDINKWWG